MTYFINYILLYISVLDKYLDSLCGAPLRISDISAFCESEEELENLISTKDPKNSCIPLEGLSEDNQSFRIIFSALRRKFGEVLTVRDIDFDLLREKYGNRTVSNLQGEVGHAIASNFLEKLTSTTPEEVNMLSREAYDHFQLRGLSDEEFERVGLEEYIIEYLRQNIPSMEDPED